MTANYKVQFLTESPKQSGWVDGHTQSTHLPVYNKLRCQLLISSFPVFTFCLYPAVLAYTASLQVSPVHHSSQSESTLWQNIEDQYHSPFVDRQLSWEEKVGSTARTEWLEADLLQVGWRSKLEPCWCKRCVTSACGNVQVSCHDAGFLPTARPRLGLGWLHFLTCCLLLGTPSSGSSTCCDLCSSCCCS